MTAVVEARGLRAGYDKTVIVRDLDLRVDAGEIVALLGANGAGKTTTLRTFAGELAPLGGQILFRGVATTEPLHRRVQGGLGLIGEERTVLMKLTVAENLRLGRGDADYAMELFPELQQHRHRQVGLLSGGQQQMLALARALSLRPSIILADELSLGLAPIIITRLLKALRAAADGGVAVLLVEQHIRQALQFSDRAYVLRRGTVVVSGESSALRRDIGQVERSYFSQEQLNHVPADGSLINGSPRV
jgi:ABC-type branched-subunit amino acid transport system ATPase component